VSAYEDLGELVEFGERVGVPVERVHRRLPPIRVSVHESLHVRFLSPSGRGLRGGDGIDAAALEEQQAVGVPPHTPTHTHTRERRGGQAGSLAT